MQSKTKNTPPTIQDKIIATTEGITRLHNVATNDTIAEQGTVIKTKKQIDLKILSFIPVFRFSIKKFKPLVTHMHTPIPQNSELIPQIDGKNHINTNIIVAPIK